jgi:hypothetical protein
MFEFTGEIKMIYRRNKNESSKSYQGIKKAASF